MCVYIYIYIVYILDWFKKKQKTTERTQSKQLPYNP